MGVFQNNLMGAAAAAGGAAAAGFYTHQIANSVRMIMADGSRLRYTPSSDGNRATWSISMWVKRAKLGDEQWLYEAGASGDADTRLRLFFNDSDQIMVGTGNANLVTSTAVFRDPSAWYHIMWKNASNTNTVHVNGVEATTVTISGNTAINSTVVHGLGCRGASGDDTSTSLDGYIAEFVLFDGTAYDYTDVTDSKNGVLIPVDPSDLTLSGTNTAWLKFESNSDMGNDSSGNNNDYTASNIAASDQTLDSPTFGSEGSANFATLNPLSSSPDNVLTEGNLFATKESGANYEDTAATMNLKGKYYVEVCAKELMTDPGQAVGLVNVKEDLITSRDGRLGETGVAYRRDGQLHTAGTSASFGTAWTAGDIVQMAVDMTDIDSVKVWFGLNNTWQNSGDPSAGSGVAATITNGEQIMAISAGYSGTGELICNFGQEGTFAGQKTAGGNADANGYGNFLYAPPTNFLALCAGNLTTAAEVDPAETDDDYPQELFFMSKYSGNLTGRTITTANQTDLLFIRDSKYAQNWYVLDSNRGITDDKYILMNTTAAEATLPQANITSVGATSVGISSGTWLNSTGSEYKMWMWRANGGTTSTNTQGDINSTVQVDPSGCFSIVTYTGTLSGAGVETVGHGLSVAPSYIITKVIASGNWWVFSDGQTSWNYGMNLNDTTVSTDKSGNGSMSAPTTTVFSTNNTEGLNDSGGNIAYCFANCEGYIKSGVYEGNGNADGAYVYCGFRPAFVISKAIDVADSWFILDETRDPSNEAVKYLQSNSSAAEAEHANIGIDILSNGFKCRRSSNALNGSGNDYIYLAFAKNPFQYATAR